MESIEVSFPAEISPSTVKSLLEGNMKTNSKFTCRVDFIGFEDGENVYNVASGDGPGAFYFIGMTASAIIARFR